MRVAMTGIVHDSGTFFHRCEWVLRQKAPWEDSVPSGARSMRFRSLALAALAASIAVASTAGATELADRAVKLFMADKPKDAIPVLEQAVKEDGADQKLRLYLGIAYQQAGRWDDSIAAFRAGLSTSVEYRHQFLFNIANSFFAQGKNAFALEYYDQAVAAKGDFAPAYLNRANARMRLGDRTGAASDYTVYLGLDPGSPQAGEIRRLLDLLGARLADEERKKADEEARKLAEEQARKAMLDAVAKSLMQAAESTTNLSAGSGDVQGYDADLSLDE